MRETAMAVRILECGRARRLALYQDV